MNSGQRVGCLEHRQFEAGVVARSRMLRGCEADEKLREHAPSDGAVVDLAPVSLDCYTTT